MWKQFYLLFIYLFVHIFIVVPMTECYSILSRYLHETCSPPVIHKNIKSANILLNADLNPHLADSGLGVLYSVQNCAMITYQVNDMFPEFFLICPCALPTGHEAELGPRL